MKQTSPHKQYVQLLYDGDKPAQAGCKLDAECWLQQYFSVNASLMSALTTKLASMLPDTAPIAVSVIVAKLIDVCQDYTVGNWRSHNVAKREKRDWHFNASLMFFNFSS